MCPHHVRDVSTRVRIMGALYRTWCLVDRFAEDGILHGYTAEALDAEVDIEGWAEQLQQVGWLIIEPQQLAIPEFESHFSQSTKRRMRDAKRKRTSRNSCPQNVRSAADKKRTTEQKRTEEKNNKTPLPPLPKKLDTPAFQQAWLLWVKHRREIHKPLTPTQAQTQLEEFSQWGMSPRRGGHQAHGGQGLAGHSRTGTIGGAQRQATTGPQRRGDLPGMIARDDENILFRNETEAHFTLAVLDCVLCEHRGWLSEVLAWFDTDFMVDAFFAALSRP
jgi:hypothetical protein